MFFNRKIEKEQGFLLMYTGSNKCCYGGSQLLSLEISHVKRNICLYVCTYIFHLSLVVAVQHEPEVNMGKMCPLKRENSLIKKIYTKIG